MSVYEARQWNLASLFVCGMTDRDFPRQHPQNLLFPGQRNRAPARRGIPLRKASDQEREEQLLFDSLRTRATSSLFLSIPGTMRRQNPRSVPAGWRNSASRPARPSL